MIEMSHKPSTSIGPPLNKPTEAELDAIRQYISQKPDFDKLVLEAKQGSNSSSTTAKSSSEYDQKIEQSVKESVAKAKGRAA